MWSLFGSRRGRLTKYHVVLVVGLRARPKQEKKVLELVLDTRKATLAENGCLAFEFHQSKADAGLFFVYQVWVDDAAVEAHLRAPHIEEFRKRAPEFLEGPALVNKWAIVQ
jgi:quinol monooxygenase YgiN